MIDQSVFKVEWKVLCERFKRDHGAAVTARYYQSLSPRMTTAEFKQACRIVFDSHEFFPTPDQFVEAISASLEELAADQWRFARSAICGLGLEEDMDVPARRALAAMGGALHLGRQAESEMKWMRKEFTALYAEYARSIERQARYQLPAGDGADEMDFVLAGNPNLLPRGDA